MSRDSRRRNIAILWKNSSGDEIANVNFYAVRPEGRKLPEFAEITQNNGHYAVQGHSRSPILVPIERAYDFLLVINTNLPPTLHRFRDIAVDRSEIAIVGYPSCLTPPMEASPKTISVKFSVA